VSAPRVAVVIFPGSNCDRDVLHVLRGVLGADAHTVWHEERSLAGFDAVILPGGFSYGDYLRAGAIAATSPILAAVRAAASAGVLVAGICNGFQILLEAGLLPGAMLPNRDATFVCDWTRIRVERDDLPFTCAYGRGQIARMPVAHGEGNYYADADTLSRLEANRQVVFRYVDDDGAATAHGNPNGALHNIAGIVDERGNVLGMMPHPERCSEALLGSCDGRAFFEGLLASIAKRAHSVAGGGR